jgi:hypothetical protein
MAALEDNYHPDGAMPADTNPAGDIFGGWLMAQMDLAAGNVAARGAWGRCATVAVESMTFHGSVFVGDKVSLFATITGTGRSRRCSSSVPESAVKIAPRSTRFEFKISYARLRPRQYQALRQSS